jgi:dipeptidyl aminopeptidase/acylaminoacyl peptidase
MQIPHAFDTSALRAPFVRTLLVLASACALVSCGDTGGGSPGAAANGAPAPAALATGPRWIFSKISTPALPELPAGRTLEPGILIHETAIAMPGGSIKVWVYLPEGAKPKSLPCVFIAPAGGNMLAGVTLGDGDRPEHLPYVKAGCAVVAYELEGPIGDGVGTATPEFKTASAKFRESWAGLKDAKAAIDFALAKVPEVDPSRLFVAGHSSAGTTALLVAAFDTRLRGALAYMPSPSVGRFHGEETMAKLEAAQPGIQDFALRSSPEALVSQMRVPLFIFGVGDDEIMDFGEIANLVRGLVFVQKPVEFARVRAGGHYGAMVNDGIPRGIEWIKKRCAEP